MGDLCTKAGERETRQKNVSLPPKVGELASLIITSSPHYVFPDKISEVLCNLHQARFFTLGK